MQLTFPCSQLAACINVKLTSTGITIITYDNSAIG